MTDQQEKRGRGRPATGVTPKRDIRIGPVWDEAREAAKADGIPFAAFVEAALREAIDRSWLNRRQSSASG